MGRLDAFTDMTGNMNQMDVNTQNIQQILDEMNRNSDQLDALTKGMNIIGRGSLSMAWNGTASFVDTVGTNHGFPSAPIFIASFTRSDNLASDGSLLSYQTPMYFFDNSGSFQQRVYAYTTATDIKFQFFSAVAGTPMNLKFSWYIIQQPAQVPTGS